MAKKKTGKPSRVSDDVRFRLFAPTGEGDYVEIKEGEKLQVELQKAIAATQVTQMVALMNRLHLGKDDFDEQTWSRFGTAFLQNFLFTGRLCDDLRVVLLEVIEKKIARIKASVGKELCKAQSDPKETQATVGELVQLLDQIGRTAQAAADGRHGRDLWTPPSKRCD